MFVIPLGECRMVYMEELESSRTTVKDIKRSVRDKYKCRLQRLACAVEQYEIAASERIKHGGKIRDRKEIDAILSAIELLKKTSP